ncbi:MAG: hypothetical protein J1F68_06215, partial [Clostridiales bacterium]|nr:hypothetical protein [Clostridiales bacterium]
MKSNLITKKTIATVVVLMLLALLFVVSAAIASTQTVAAAAEAEQQAAELQQALEAQVAQAEKRFQLEQSGEISGDGDVNVVDSEKETSTANEPVISTDELPAENNSDAYDVMPISSATVTNEYEFRDAYNDVSIDKIIIGADFSTANTLDNLTRALTIDFGNYVVTFTYKADKVLEVARGGTLTLMSSSTATRSVSGYKPNGSNTPTSTTVSVTGGVIRGAYVIVRSGGTLNFQNGANIVGVYSASGALFLEAGSTLNMTGGSISNNYGAGGIYSNGATITMSGSAKVSYNTSITVGGSGRHGGGIELLGKSILTMSGSVTISNNHATGAGGGVHVGGTSVFNMQGGTITGNTSNYGAGVSMYNGGSSATFTMTGGSITGNSCTTAGGGIYYPIGVVNISGAITIKNNTNTVSGSADNLYIHAITNPELKVNIAAAITGTAVVGLSYKNSDNSVGVITKGLQLTSTAAFFSDDTSKSVGLNSGYLDLGSNIIGSNPCASGHTITPVAAVAATCAEYGRAAYWYCTVCHKYFSNSGATSEITDFNTWLNTVGQGKVAKKTTHTYGNYEWNASQHWKACTVCGVKSSTGAHSYTYASANDSSHTGTCACGAKTTGNHSLSYTAGNNGTHTAKCSTCSYNKSLTCTPQSYTYTKDSSNHYLTCSTCSGKINNGAHSYGSYQWNGSTHWKECTVCSYQNSSASHSYTNWKSNGANSHTGTCVCGATSTVDHKLTTTANNNGTHTVKCSGCTYSSTVTCSPSSFTYTTDGTYHYLTCSICKGKVNNSAHTWKYEKLNETSHRQYCSVCGKVGSASTAHGTLTNITTTNNGTHSGVCSVCNGSVTVACTPQNNGSYVQTTTGHYLECSVCGGKMNSGDHVYNGAYLGSDTDSIHYRDCAVCSYRGDTHAAAASSYIYYDTNTHQGTCSVAGCG